MLVQVCLVHRCCTLGEWPERFIIKKEVEPTFSVFQTTQSTTPQHILSIWLLYGTEYDDPIAGSHDHNVPCAVCHATTRAAKVMIPARTSCPPNWTREYYGYLESEANAVDRQRTEFVCVDKDQVPLAGSQGDTNGALLYHVKAACHGIQCPLYNVNDVLTCTVCTN